MRSAAAAAAVYKTVELARRDGALVVADPNLRPALGDEATFRAAMAPLRGAIDVALGDAQELALLSGTAPDDAADALLAAGCRIVVSKRGAQGAWASDGDGTVEVPSNVAAADVVDTVGAGDAFAAGLIAALIERVPLAAAMQRASESAAQVVRVRGDVAPAHSEGSAS